MKTELYLVNATNEIPRIGCGSRIVRARVGRKWVRLTDNHPVEEARSRQRITIRAWNKLSKEFIKDLGDIKL